MLLCLALSSAAFQHQPVRLSASKAQAPLRFLPPVLAEQEDEARPTGYYEGMISSPLDARSDEDLDNITPNLKLVLGSTAVVAALCVAFVLSNEPPPASLPLTSTSP